MNSQRSTAAQHAGTWSKESLLAKTQRYAEEMLSHPREDWRCILWSTLVLELLSRAALASISPTLLADAKGNWRNVYFALGHEPTKSTFRAKSIDTSEVLSRLGEILSDFTTEHRDEAQAHIRRRNAELHAGGCTLDGLGTSKWLPGFYRVCEVLLRSMGETLEDLFGPQDAALARDLIAAARDESAKAVAQRIHVHMEEWAKKTSVEQQRLRLQSAAWAMRHNGHRVECPSCGTTALVTGSPMRPLRTKLDGGEITETQELLPSRFECIACSLRINGLSQLSAAGLGDSYTATHVYDAAEYLAIDDDFDEYEPDFNEP